MEPPPTDMDPLPTDLMDKLADGRDLLDYDTFVFQWDESEISIEDRMARQERELSGIRDSLFSVERTLKGYIDDQNQRYQQQRREKEEAAFRRCVYGWVIACLALWAGIIYATVSLSNYLSGV